MKYLIMICCAVLGGCASRPLGGSPNIDVVQGGLPAPVLTDTLATDDMYKLGAYDLLVISVFGIEGMEDRDIRIDGGGEVTFPLAGTIRAAGLTPGEFRDRLRDRLRASYIRDPQVTVNLKESKSRLVTVSGEVREPGPYPVLPNMTLIRAIASARGLSELGSRSNVVVFRTVEGRKLAALYNLGAIERGAYDDPRIYPEDVIVVGDNAARRIFRDAISLLPALTTPLVVALQQ